MAATLVGDVILPAKREIVWQALNQPDILGRCIPGCEEVVQIGDTEFSATARVVVGPVKARFSGTVHFVDIDALNGYTINGEGRGGLAGFVKGSAIVRLTDEDGHCTRMSYDVRATVGGKLAQLGGRLINSVAKKYADDFFTNFAKLVVSEQPNSIEPTHV